MEILSAQPRHILQVVRPQRASTLQAGVRMSEKVIIGVDGGGTKSLAALVSLKEPTLVLSTARAGGCNGNSEGCERANKNLQSSIDDAIAQAGIKPHQVKCISCGIAGVDTLQDVKEHREVLRGILQRHAIPDSVPCFVYNDAIAALAAATAGSPYGITVVAGTGAITLGCSDHASHRAAGWGPAFRDGGCGYDIGQRGLAAAAASIDGRGLHSSLEEALPRACQVESMLEVMHWVYREPHSWSRIASLAPAVIQCASAGDRASCNLLQDCAVELVKSVKAVWSKVADQGSTPLPLALSGGLLCDENNAIYCDMVKQELQQALPAHAILWPKVDAAVGAALLGRHYLNKDKSDHVGGIWHGVIDEAKKPAASGAHVASSAHASPAGSPLLL